MLRFVLILGTLILGFNVFYYLWISQSSFMHGYLNIYAKVSAAILSVLEDDVTASGRLVDSPRFSMSIAIGCDAIQASAFFVFAVLAAPLSGSIVSRVPYVVIGLLFLWFLNLVRIISLFFTGVYFPDAFEVMHIEVWQAVFIFVPLIMWIVWSRRMMRTEGTTGDVSH